MSESSSEILLFQVGPHVFATRVRDVVRIGATREMQAGDLVTETALGVPFGRERGIVVASPGDERTLVVDQVVGFRTVGEHDVQPLPAFAAACIRLGALAGLVVVDDIPTPFIDLPALLRERTIRSDAAPP